MHQNCCGRQGEDEKPTRLLMCVDRRPDAIDRIERTSFAYRSQFSSHLALEFLNDAHPSLPRDLRFLLSMRAFKIETSSCNGPQIIMTANEKSDVKIANASAGGLQLFSLDRSPILDLAMRSGGLQPSGFLS
jgi:hypothetical protein